MPTGLGRHTSDDGLSAANPDPRNFNIQIAAAGPEATALMVHYPDATNYEGLKILVVEGRMTEEDVSLLTALDPHFSDVGMHRVLARFVPTDWGWAEAVALATGTLDR